MPCRRAAPARTARRPAPCSARRGCPGRGRSRRPRRASSAVADRDLDGRPSCPRARGGRRCRRRLATARRTVGSSTAHGRSAGPPTTSVTLPRRGEHPGVVDRRRGPPPPGRPAAGRWCGPGPGRRPAARRSCACSRAAADRDRSSPRGRASSVGSGWASSTSALVVSTASGVRSSWLVSSISRRWASAACSSRSSMASKLAARATTSVGPRSRPMRRLRSEASMSSATDRTRSIGRTARPASHQATAAAAGAEGHDGPGRPRRARRRGGLDRDLRAVAGDRRSPPR